MRYLLCGLLILASVPGFSQVSLRWKVRPDDILVYKTVMKEVDTSSFSFSRLRFGMMAGLPDSVWQQKAMDSLFDEMRKYLDHTDFFTRLSAGRGGVIHIEMAVSPETDTARSDTAVNKATRLASLLTTMNKGAMLRGAVNEDGTMQSFYVKNDQRNLIALLFELPGRPVSVGDTWSIDVHLLSMDQNFTCDSSYRKDVVTLVDVKKAGGETVAVLRYDLAEYVSGSFTSPLEEKAIPTYLKMTHRALATFSVDRGRWLSYEAIMTVQSAGVMDSHVVKKISLIPN